ncbi:MAG: methylenetetrahydrofolate reductase, partial [Acidimicrobiales bacterium]
MTTSAGPTSSVRIDELLAIGPTRSFEFFPPKSDTESAVLAASLEDIQPLQPSFVSVTYRGGRESRQRTYDLVTQIESDGYVSVMAHVICV